MKVMIELESSELNAEVLSCLQAMSEIVNSKEQKRTLKKEKPIGVKQEKPKDEQKKEEKEEKVETKEENIKKYTFEEVKSAAIMLKEAKGKEVAKQVLKLFKASKLQEIKEEDYDDFIKVVEEAL